MMLCQSIIIWLILCAWLFLSFTFTLIAISCFWSWRFRMAIKRLIVSFLRELILLNNFYWNNIYIDKNQLPKSVRDYHTQWVTVITGKVVCVSCNYHHWNYPIIKGFFKIFTKIRGGGGVEFPHKNEGVGKIGCESQNLTKPF